jgi:amino acid adenylation domain-containing protein/non-ribosomal peptide synthase protein (TIGR01720 family)
MTDFNLVEIIGLLKEANNNGISISFDNNNIQLHIDEEQEVDAIFLDRLKDNRDYLIEYFKLHQQEDSGLARLNDQPENYRYHTGHIPLSFNQERLWFIDQLEGSVAYHIPVVLRVNGNIDPSALELALQKIIDRHSILRTIILEEDGQPYQHVLEVNEWKLSHIAERVVGSEPDSGSASTSGVEHSLLQGQITALIRTPFNLAKDYPLRAHLLPVSENEQVLVLILHHIAFDGWSTDILMHELIGHYDAVVKGEDIILAPLELQYSHYAIWQREFLAGTVLEKKLSYWRDKLTGVPALHLPAVRQPVIMEKRSATVLLHPDSALSLQLQQISRQEGTTLFMTLLTAFKVLLYRYSGQEDICVGTSTAGRQHQKIEGLIGFFVNTLALRSDLSNNPSFTTLLRQVKQTTLEAYEYQDVPFEKIVETVVRDRGQQSSSLFNCMLVLRSEPGGDLPVLGTATLSEENIKYSAAKFDITFFIIKRRDDLQIQVEYREDLFHAATIEQLTGHFHQLLLSIVKTPSAPINELSILTKDERNLLLYDFSPCVVTYPKELTFLDLFDAQVMQHPHQEAVVFEGDSLTYGELSARANQLARYLRQLGVTAHSRVPVCMDRSVDIMVGILAILKSGAAYVPIEPDYPVERIAFILEDTGARVVLADRGTKGKIPATAAVRIVVVEEEQELIDSYPVTALPDKVTPDQLVYIIYTSGSTGTPKGVMISHGNLADYLFGLNEKLDIYSCRSFALVSGLSTDLGNTVVYGALAGGGALHLFSKAAINDIDWLYRYFETEEIECVKIVPSHWKALSTEDKLLLPSRLLIFGGDVLPTDLVRQIRAHGGRCTIVNHYGPTETTIGKLLHIVGDTEQYEASIPVGRPFSNTRVYVLNREKELCPVGVPGELYIGGEGLAAGYLNNEELSRVKFIDQVIAGVGQTRLYGTGDLVRFREDGNIQFIGRADNQVKVRGYRVELGEIESILRQWEGVSQAVVLAKSDNKGGQSGAQGGGRSQAATRLVAYLVTTDDYEEELLLHWLKGRLPEHMIPSQYIVLEAFPLTGNGKIDRQALPDGTEAREERNGSGEPRNETEQQLVTIWENLLEVENIGVQDDFFKLGGHSLLAIRLISAIRKTLKVEVSIGDVFDYPTIAGLSDHFSKKTGLVLPAITRHRLGGNIPLSYSQERLWFIDQMEGSIQYHVPAVLDLEGALDQGALHRALQSIVNRHEVLRTVITQEGGYAIQQVLGENQWKLNVVKEQTAESLPSYISALIHTPFDLSRDHMLRAYLFPLAENRHKLFIMLHHIASDGWSKSVIVSELAALYEAFASNRKLPLSPLVIQYADYAVWQRTYLTGEMLKTKLAYWKDKLKNITSLDLPADFVRPEVQSTRGSYIAFHIEKELSTQLQKLSQAQGTTLFMTLLAAFKVLLYRYSGQEDICVGSAIAGRTQQEMEGMIGFFVNTLALRSDLRNNPPFTSFLQQIKETTLGAYAHQEVPFEKVVEALVGERDVSRNPLFQVIFALQNTPDVPMLTLGEVVLTQEAFPHTTSMFDISVSLTENEEGIRATAEYCTDLFTEATMHRMFGHFVNLLHAIVASPVSAIKSLPMLSNAEIAALLASGNDNAMDYPSDSTVVGLFETQVIMSPDRIAVTFGEQQLTYTMLDERANQVANYLAAMGAGKGNNIGLSAYRGLDMIIAIWGILKSGNAYVPFHTAYPPERLQLIAEDADISHVLYTDQGLFELSGLASHVESFPIAAAWNYPVTARREELAADDRVYIMYTSGTTGRPKGIAVNHRNIIKLVYDPGAIAVLPDDKLLQWSNYAFDGSTYDIYCSLMSGACLCMVKDDEASDVFELARIILHEKITISFVTTALFNNFVDNEISCLQQLRKLLFGGERVSLPHVQKAFSLVGPGKLVHVYGPTETTVYATSWPIDAVPETGTIPIGYPLTNSLAIVLDDLFRPVPAGVKGELFIGGDGVAMGYVNNEPLTSEKFLVFKDLEGRWYRTGDLVRQLQDGAIEYAGRTDDQVKVRGYRIELGEIERALDGLESIAANTVVVKEYQGAEKRLIAYYLPDMDSVRTIEKELQLQHVESWNELYETEYSKADEVAGLDEEFNITGWNDSFSGGSIGEEQMREWLEDISRLILTLNPHRVLEIGSGTGLIYYQLVGHIEKYTGTDFSRVSIQQMLHHIGKGLREYPETVLHLCPAHKLTLDDSETVDLVILNSIVQYFPGEQYLTDVLERALLQIHGAGRILVGDVRDKRLLPSFKRRLQLKKIQGSTGIREFEWNIGQEVLREEELCITPEYFYHFKSLHPEITHIEISWKQGIHSNELTLYRYTVIMHAGIQEDILRPDWQNWEQIKDHRGILRQLNGERIALKGVPNHRLWRERLLDQATRDPMINTAGDLSDYTGRPDEAAVIVEELLTEARAAGYHCRFFLHEDLFKMNLLIERIPFTGLVETAFGANILPVQSTTNIPLFADICAKLQKDIRSRLQESLPEYMVPSDFVALQHLPLTVNGKTDRKFLSTWGDIQQKKLINYQAPETAMERQLAAIWEGLLGVEHIGVHDNFFELGGHSLLATRLVSAVRKQLGVELTVKNFFLYPVIKELAAYLQTLDPKQAAPAIIVAERPALIPLSFSQERLWFIDRLEGSVQYHMPAVLNLEGALDVKALEHALQQIVNRHEILRTVIEEHGGRACQRVLDKDLWTIQVISDQPSGEYINSLIRAPFDLSRDHMLRTHLFRLSDNKHTLVLTMHHIASDGWSISIIVRELVELYSAYTAGRIPQLQPLEVQYADYAIWQRAGLAGSVLEKKMAYWRNKLTGILPLNLPTDYKRPPVQSRRGAYINLKIDNGLTEQVRQLGQQEGATLYMVLLTAFKVLLYRYSGQEDICIGSPIAGRTHKELEGLIGFFVNTLALRSDLSNNPSFTALLQQVKETTLSAYDHQEIPFEKIVDQVATTRDMSRTPLFQIMFALQNTPDVPELSLGDVRLSPGIPDRSTSKFDITVLMTEGVQGLDINVEYCTDLFSAGTINRLFAHYERLLRHIVKVPSCRIAALSMLSGREKQQILVEFNDTATIYPAHQTIPALFSQQAMLTPQAIALVFGEQIITYKELDERSSRLAHYLRSKGVKLESLVPLCMERSADLIIAILGILKAGGAYVPLDPGYPAERLQYMLSETDSPLALTIRANREQMVDDHPDKEWISIDEIPEILSAQNTNLTVIDPAPGNLAYVIYTSGSTGKPKGVMVTHNNVVSLVKGAGYIALSESDVLLSTGSPSFDASTFEYWSMLLNGGQLILCAEHTLLDSSLLKKEIRDRQVSIMWFTSSWLNQLVDTDIDVFQGLKVVLAGGEKLSEEHIGRLMIAYPELAIINGYGPTENTTFSLTWPIIDRGIKHSLPIGRPLSNRQAYIFDAQQQLVPVGVPGELYVGGAGISRGYLGKAALTAERFIPAPFSIADTGHSDNLRLYRTGDLCRWLPDGNVEYLGRIDDQVKVRGFRVEPGEIEQVLLQCNLVSQAVVVTRKISQDSAVNQSHQLIAYIVPRGIFDREGILSWLGNTLPAYMIPAFLVELPALPLTANGKVNKAALPDLDLTQISTKTYVAPGNETERKLAGIWKDLLGVERIGIYDNFFELGGDSIITIQVVSRAKRAGFYLQPRDLFVHQTISALSILLATQKAGQITGEQGILIGDSGLLPIQQWYLEEPAGISSHFNQSLLLSIDRSVTTADLTKAVVTLVSYHDALRFRYSHVTTGGNQDSGKWEQYYGDYEGVLDVEDLRDITGDDLSATLKTLYDNYQRSLDITNGVLVRAVLFLTPETEKANRLLLIIHHLAVDSVSRRILLDDLEQLLNNEPLGEKGTSYREWYQALQRYGQSRKVFGQRDYWNHIVQAYRPLKTDTANESILRMEDTAKYRVQLDQSYTQKLLQEVSAAYHTEINDMLISALAGTLADWNGHPEICIGLEGHGRESIAPDKDISHTAGWFTNLYPVLLHAGTQQQPGTLLKSIKEQLRRIPEKGIGYGVLKYIAKEASLQSITPWDITFNYHGQADQVASSSKWFSFAPESAGEGIGGEYVIRDKMSVNSIVIGGELVVEWTYSRYHYEPATILHLAGGFISRLEALIDHCVQQAAIRPEPTPSDYGLGGVVSIAELDQFLAMPLPDGSTPDDTNPEGTTRLSQISGLYKLSGLQEGMLFHSLYDGDSGAYIVQFACDLHELDTTAFRQSWQYLLNKHSVLRSGFYHDVFRVPVQCVYRDVKAPIAIYNYRHLDKNAQLTAIQTYEMTDRSRGFGWEDIPLMRIGLMQLTEADYRMVWSFHHILLDGWSIPVLIEELLQSYELYATGVTVTQAGEDRYEDYIRYLERQDKEEEESWWRRYLAGVTSSTLLPFLANTPERTKGKGVFKSVRLGIGKEQTANVTAFAQYHRITINTLMQGIWSFMLARYTGNNHVLYGVIVSGRPDDLPGIESRVGMYINTVPLHAVINENQGIVEWLQQLQDGQLQSREYQYSSLHDIRRWTGISGDLFDSLMIFENYPVNRIIGETPWKLKVDNVNAHEQTNYPFSVKVSTGEELNIDFIYNALLLEDAYAGQIAAHFDQVLEQMIGSEDGKTGSLTLLNAAARHTLLYEFNDTAVSYPQQDLTILDLFSQQVAQNPERIAVVYEQETLSFRQLDHRSNQLARYLRSKGVKEETLVPVCINRSPDMIISLLGVLKAGGAYVPVDPAYPAERKEFILKDTGASLILGHSDCISTLEMTRDIQEAILLDKMQGMIAEYPVDALGTVLHSGNLAYVIYTSGSTGVPKGVMNEHRGVVNRLLWTQQYFGLTTADAILQKTTFCFDVSVWELFWPLISGARLVFASQEGQKDTDYLKRAIGQYGVTTVHFVPSMLTAFLDSIVAGDCPGLKRVLCSGEALKPAHVKEFHLRLPAAELYNLYGPTEAAIDVTCWHAAKEFPSPEIVPIGHPVANTQLYILDTAGQLVPEGIAGELYIGGVQVARGYLGREALTAEKFIKDPFSESVNGADKLAPDIKRTGNNRLYRTGDICRWLPDGNVEYLGRTDDQVKIRGYRIELGEIENALQRSAMVKDAVVVAGEGDNGNRWLTGYVVPEKHYDRNSIFMHLKNILPEYMVPAMLVELDELPLTFSGKVDRKSLPDPLVTGLSGHSYVAPGNKTEETLADIWQDLLGLQWVGTADNFFELGGNSILAIQVVSGARRAGYELSLKDLFTGKTIEAIACLLAARANDISERVNPYILSPLYRQYLDSLTGHQHILLLNKGIASFPLFLLPGSKGICDGYEELATAMNESGAVYGLQMTGIFEEESPLTDIKKIAAQNISWIKQIQPAGPYRFVAHSFGGAVAFEMVKQLEKKKEVVSLLAMLDADAAARNALRDEENAWDASNAKNSAEKNVWLKGLHKTALAAKLQQLESENLKALIGYNLSGKIKAPLLVVKAADQPGLAETGKQQGLTKDIYQGWAPHAKNREEITMPGDHFSMVQGENAIILGTYLSKKFGSEITATPIGS